MSGRKLLNWTFLDTSGNGCAIQPPTPSPLTGLTPDQVLPKNIEFGRFSVVLGRFRPTSDSLGRNRLLWKALFSVPGPQREESVANSQVKKPPRARTSANLSKNAIFTEDLEDIQKYCTKQPKLIPHLRDIWMFIKMSI